MRESLPISFIAQELDRQNLLPAIVFRSARSQCDADAERAGANQRMKLSPTLQRELRQRVHEIVSCYDMDLELITSHPHYAALVTTGVGAHHAGQLLMWRLLLEELMAAGLLRVLVATGTVAAGVDFPARTVVITAHSKRGADGFRQLTAAEFQQMSGRAGRRGRDTVGFCVAAPSPFCDARQLLHIAKQPPEPLVSSYFPSPSTVLNLLRYRNVDDLRYTVERSLASFIDRKHAEGLREQGRGAAERLPATVRERVLSEVGVPAEVGATKPHPDDDDGFENQSVQLSREDKRLTKRVRRFFREARELEQRQRSLLDASLEGLGRLGYVDGVTLSEKGNWAANLCTTLVIELAEIIESGMLDGISAEALVAIVASISGDPHRSYLSTKNPPLSKELLQKLHEIIVRVRDSGMPGASDDRTPVPFAAYTAVVWLQSEDWHQFRSLLLLSGVAEGDAARLITQTAEHLNQLSRLGETHPQLALRAEEAKRRILRPPLTEVINLETI